MRNGAGPETHALVSGYSPDNPDLSHRDLPSLRAGRQLRNRAVNEMGRRLVIPADPLVFYSASGLEGPYRLDLVERAKSQHLWGAWFGKTAGGFSPARHRGHDARGKSRHELPPKYIEQDARQGPSSQFTGRARNGLEAGFNTGP